jgi:predicted RNA-binding Zn-ribbon protein involved in translation (DUF1610 family)
MTKTLTATCKECGRTVRYQAECARFACPTCGLIGYRPTKRIELFKAGGCWIADFVGDADVEWACGQTAIPTPYTAQAPSWVVLAAVQARNPHATVTVR